MYFLIFGLLLFFLPHLYSAFRSRESGKDISEKLGIITYKFLYSCLALLGLVLMIWGYTLARPSPLIYQPPNWGSHITFAIMWPAMILLFAAYGPRGYIKNTLKHPFLLSVFLWSSAHLLANGELNSLVLFASFLIYSLIALFAAFRRPIDLRKANLYKPKIFGDIYAILVGSAVYFLFIMKMHQILFNVSPL